MRNYNKESLPELFDEALSLEGGERETFLAEISDSSPEVAAELQRLLEAAPSEAGMPHSLPGALVGHAVVPDDADLPEEIGGYRIKSQLGVGGMGTVYLGYREDLGRHVALKIAHGADPAGRRAEALGHEARTLAGLRHPHIANVIDWGTLADGRHFVVTDYVDGRDIRRYCREEALGLTERVLLFRQVVDAVAYAHANLVIHRDIKPGNVLVDTAGHIRVIDFGIARNLEAEEGAYEQTAHPPVTPEYASPEQLAGLPLTVHSDVYSLGAVLYELLTGCKPFTREGRRLSGLDDSPERPSRVAAALSDAPPGLPEPRTLARRLKGDLDTILGKALAARVEERYQTASAFAEDLQRFLERRPIQAQRPSLLYLLGKAISRNRTAAVATAAAVIALVSGITFGAVQWQRAVEEREQAIESRDRLRDYSTFQTSLMRELDAYSGGDPNMSMSQFVDAGLNRLQESERLDDESRAWFSINLGSIYDSWGHYDKALEALEIGLKYAARSESPHDEISLITEKALVFDSARRYEEAIPTARKAVRLAEASEETAWRMPAARLALADGLLRAGRPLDAKRETDLLIDDPEVRTVYKAFAGYIQAEAMTYIYRLDLARDRLELAFPEYRERYGEGSAQLVDAEALSFLIATRDDPTRSREETIDHLLKSFPEAYPDGHPRFAHLRSYIAEYHFLRGELTRAIDHQRQAMEILKANGTVAFTEILPIRFDLVRYLLFAGRPGEAAQVLWDIEPQEEVPVPDHLRAENLALRGWLATIRGEHAEAADAFGLARDLLEGSAYDHLEAELGLRGAQLAAARGEWRACSERAARAEELARETVPQTWSLPDIYAVLGERCRARTAGAQPPSEAVFRLPDSLRDSPWAGEFRALKAAI